MTRLTIPQGLQPVSQNFEPANDAFDDQVADDFVVPAGGWTIGQVNVGGQYFNGPGPAASFNVTFYADAATFPGAPVPGGTYTDTPITFGTRPGSFNIVCRQTLALRRALTGFLSRPTWISPLAANGVGPTGQLHLTRARRGRIPRRFRDHLHRPGEKEEQPVITDPGHDQDLPTFNARHPATRVSNPP